MNVSNVTNSATTLGEESASSLADAEDTTAASELGILSVEIVGFGEDEDS